MRATPMLALLFACGGDGGETPSGADAPLPDAPRGPRGRIVGTVSSPNGAAADVVPGAIVSIAGRAPATADGRGRFVIDDVPAGTPIALTVRGPAGNDVYGTHDVRLSVPDGGTATVSPAILRGCRAVVDGAAGGTAAFDRCAGAGGVSVEFPAGAFAAASGDVLVEMAAIDPATPGDIVALPPDGMGDEGPAILGGAEIRLVSAATGDPVALAPGATAKLRFEIAAPPAGLETAEVSIRFYDPVAGAWVEEGPGTVVADGNRRYVERTVTHFTTYIGVSCCTSPVSTCLLVVPQVCNGTSCTVSEAVDVEIVDTSYRRPRTMRLDPNDLTGRACIPVLPNHIFDMTFRYYDPVTEDFAESRRLGVRSGSCLPDAGERCSPGNASCIPVTCTNLCDPTDRGGACIVELHPPRFGCVTGSLVTGSGDPIDGVLRAFVNGNMVGEVLLPTAGTCDTGAGVCAADDVECASSFCTRVPIGSSLGAQVELRDGVGNSVSFIPTPPTAGAPAPMCPASRPAACGAPTTACEDLGTIAAACDEEGPIPQRCMRARFTWQAEENTASCPGAGNFEVSFDGSASSGDISYFEWRLQSVWLDESGPTWSTCLPEGRYLVTMLTVGSGRELRARGVAQNIVDVRPRPCRSTYDGLVAPLTTSITCTYGDSTRDCLASDGRRTLVTYADKPCGWPCLSGNPFELASTGLAFDPINRPWSEVAVTTSLGTSRLENLLDDFGNVVSSTAYDVNGVAGVPVTYAYDDPARPMRIEVMSPGAPTTTFTLGWDGPRLQSWGLPPGFVTGVVEYGYDGNRLSQVEWRNAQGVREALVPFTYDGDSVTMSWIRRDTEQARVTYDFACP